MTLKHARMLLIEANQLIFSVEQALSNDSDNPLRKQGYRARIKVCNLIDDIKNRNSEDISKEK